MTPVVVGRYQLIREVGRGGMGAVWLAQDTVLERPVALKQVGLLPGSEVADLERVRREARVSAMLNHPNVVAVFDLVDEGDQHWLVMEYVASDTLAQLIRREGSLTPDQAAVVVGQAARALAAAHEADIVHRDVKPSNILVTPDGVAKLGDFGIARSAADMTLTQTGMVTGSPGYIAPEVAAGGQASQASDIWSLGATVFHAVAGSIPYDSGQNLMGALYRLVHEEPPRTDRAGWLAPMLEATMHRDPEGRWSAEQVATFLERGPGAEPPTQVMSATSPSPAGPTVADQTALMPARRRWIPWLAAAGALLLTVIVILVVVALTPDDDSPSRAGGAASSPAGETQASSPARPTAAGMAQFVEDYLAEVVRDPRSAWETRLTPDFQDASGGFDSYSDFWTTIENARASEVTADTESMTVHYTVDYETRSGDDRVDEVTLVLDWDGERLRIAEEP